MRARLHWPPITAGLVWPLLSCWVWSGGEPSPVGPLGALLAHLRRRARARSGGGYTGEANGGDDKEARMRMSIGGWLSKRIAVSALAAMAIVGTAGAVEDPDQFQFGSVGLTQAQD